MVLTAPELLQLVAESKNCLIVLLDRNIESWVPPSEQVARIIRKNRCCSHSKSQRGCLGAYRRGRYGVMRSEETFELYGLDSVFLSTQKSWSGFGAKGFPA
jgi:hypothetical protein